MRYFILNNADATEGRYGIAQQSSGTVRSNLARTKVILKTIRDNADISGQPFNGHTSLTQREALIEIRKVEWVNSLT